MRAAYAPTSRNSLCSPPTQATPPIQLTYAACLRAARLFDPFMSSRLPSRKRIRFLEGRFWQIRPLSGNKQNLNTKSKSCYRCTMTPVTAFLTPSSKTLNRSTCLQIIWPLSGYTNRPIRAVFAKNEPLNVHFCFLLLKTSYTPPFYNFFLCLFLPYSTTFTATAPLSKTDTALYYLSERITPRAAT